MRLRSLGRWSLLLSPCLLVSLSVCLPMRVRGEDIIDSPMYHDPDLPVPPIVMVFPEKAKVLWLRALERPEAEMRVKAADAIALACRRGVKGMDTTIAPLLAALNRADQHPTARLTVAQALIALDARQAAPSLFQQALAGSSDLRNLVEPVLARWDYKPAREVWLKRLSQPAVSRRDFTLAMQGLAAVGEDRAADLFRKTALAETNTGPVRLEAARALARLRDQGLEKDAERLGADLSPRGLVNRLVAAALLARHRSAQAVALLQRLTQDKVATVATPAAARLLEIDPKLLLPATASLLDRLDPGLRLLAVEALYRVPSAANVHVLAGVLDDVHPDVRQRARRALRDLAEKKGLRSAVIAVAGGMLSTGHWQALEQSAILLTQLDDKATAPRLLVLLRHPRLEVTVAAAWGLRKLDVPETLPGVLGHVRACYEHPARLGLAYIMQDHRLSQLNQFMGYRKYVAADAVLRQFIPKQLTKVGGESRAAAIWALGRIHEGKSMPDLARLLEDRLNDSHSIPPEDNRVRLMSAITLGRLTAKEALPSLRSICRNRHPTHDPIYNACGWAIGRITGETMLPPQTERRVQRDWFLSPLD
jgi:HEAT repeat protein